ncbi:MAG: LURP-one-related family protein [Clostridia bacterium]|nr:LURP-one-related family protein [Clostridia bacterium]
MKLLFEQRLFSWLDSFEITDESGRVVFTAKAELSLIPRINIYDASGCLLGSIRKRVLSFLSRFELYFSEEYAGCITKEFTFLKPRYTVEYNGWAIEGDVFGWDYSILDSSSRTIAVISRQLAFTDTYSIDISAPADALPAVMVMLAIDYDMSKRD